ncbi:MAG: 4-(cytidine 5'-diphospho)-2-C-methyl-D-erythritol kinase [Candidatus Sumerlaeota bacterium]
MNTKAPAKINLSLRIVRRRPDGYHDIETVFQELQLSDQIAFEPDDTGELTLNISGPRALPGLESEKNLILRAARMLEQYAQDRKISGRFELEKHIPVGGGLGGGSSDAAAALLLVDSALDLQLSGRQLAEAGARLGADVPFFLLDATSAVGRGVGNKLSPVDHKCKWHVVLAFPPYGLSTADVFKRFDPLLVGDPADTEALVAALNRGDLEAALELMTNALERPAFEIQRPLAHLREHLESIAGRSVRMTGSGSTLFTLTSDADQARAIAQKWNPHCQSMVTRFA